MRDIDPTTRRPPETQSPFNPVPPVALALFVAIIGIEVAFNLGARGIIGGPQAVGWRQAAIQNYGFNSDIMRWMLENRVFPADQLMRFVTYPFIHGNFTHALFAGVMLLALGKFVGEVFRPWATLAVFATASVVGAGVYGLMVQDTPWMIGAFPGVYGLIGGFTYLLWLRLGQVGARQARAFSLIGILMLLQLIFGLLFGGNSQWVADVSGFVAGFGMSFVVSPGGWSKIRKKLLQR